MTWKRRSTSPASRTADGSSMMMSFVSWDSARAMLTICCPAADRLPTSADGRDLGVAEPLEEPGGRLGRGAALGEAEARLLVAEVDVLGDAEALDEVELLVDRRDPEVHRGLRVGEAHLLALPGDGALVGLVDPGEDLDEGRLAGAVLAEEAVHLAGADVEVHPAECDHSRETLHDVGHAQEGRGAVACHGSGTLDALLSGRQAKDGSISPCCVY